MKQIGILLAMIFVLFAFPVHVFADEIGSANAVAPIEIKYEGVNPDNGLSYDLKRLREKFNLWLYSWSSASKADYYLILADRRLAELKYIIDNKQMAFFEKGTQRYFSTTGQFANFLSGENLDNEKDRAVSLFKSHIPVLENLRDNFDSSTAEWRFVQDDINYLYAQIKQLE